MLLKFTIFIKLLEYSLIFCQTEIFVHKLLGRENLKVGSLLYQRLSNKWLFVAFIVKLNMFTGFQRYCNNHFIYIKILLSYIYA